MKKIKTNTAQLSIGSKLGYSNEYFSLIELKKFIKDNSELSVEITETTIVYRGMDEKHFKLSIMNYPQQKKKNFKRLVIDLTKKLMQEFRQNRIILLLNNKTYIFENSKKQDPNIY